MDEMKIKLCLEATFLYHQFVLKFSGLMKSSEWPILCNSSIQLCLKFSQQTDFFDHVSVLLLLSGKLSSET